MSILIAKFNIRDKYLIIFRLSCVYLPFAIVLINNTNAKEVLVLSIEGESTTRGKQNEGKK